MIHLCEQWQKQEEDDVTVTMSVSRRQAVRLWYEGQLCPSISDPPGCRMGLFSAPSEGAELNPKCLILTYVTYILLPYVTFDMGDTLCVPAVVLVLV